MLMHPIKCCDMQVWIVGAEEWINVRRVIRFQEKVGMTLLREPVVFSLSISLLQDFVDFV